jgi:hypothetical protein
MAESRESGTEKKNGQMKLLGSKKMEGREWATMGGGGGGRRRERRR